MSNKYDGRARSLSGDAPAHRSGGTVRGLAAATSAAIALAAAMITFALLVVVGSPLASWAMARIGVGASELSRPILAGVVLAVLGGIVWGIFRVARLVYRFIAAGLFRILWPNELS